jgi:hypothetical protein
MIAATDRGKLLAAPGGGGTPVCGRLHLDGQSYRRTAEDSVAEELTRTVLRQKRHSAGRKPGWFGGLIAGWKVDGIFEGVIRCIC